MTTTTTVTQERENPILRLRPPLRIRLQHFLEDARRLPLSQEALKQLDSWEKQVAALSEKQILWAICFLLDRDFMQGNLTDMLLTLLRENLPSGTDVRQFRTDYRKLFDHALYVQQALVEIETTFAGLRQLTQFQTTLSAQEQEDQFTLLAGQIETLYAEMGTLSTEELEKLKQLAQETNELGKKTIANGRKIEALGLLMQGKKPL